MWCDRLPISHSLTLDELIYNWPTKLNYTKETSINLKEVILDIYDQTKCISDDSQFLLRESILIKLHPAKVNNKYLETYSETITSNTPHIFLLNILSIIYNIKPMFIHITKDHFAKSLSLQSLALLIQEIIGNNIKEYRHHSDIDPH